MKTLAVSRRSLAMSVLVTVAVFCFSLSILNRQSENKNHMQASTTQAKSSSAVSYPFTTNNAKSQEKPLPKEVSDNWLSTVKEDIGTQEYEVTLKENVNVPGLEGVHSVYQAPNRAQNFRTYFTEEGPRVVSRTENQSSWIWGLEFAGIGDQISAVEEVKAENNRVDYVRSNGVIEWYKNDEKGLEQGFTIEKPISNNNEIVVALAVRGNLKGRVRASDNSLEFLNSSGANVINFGKLIAYDSAGKDLPARMEISKSETSASQNIKILVDASGAQYPIIIDPLATSAAWAVESNQENALFGYSVSTAGDVNGDGYSDIIVGASKYDNGEDNEGTAFVYYGSASGLSTTSDWSMESNQGNGNFGSSVSTAGDVNGDGYSDVIIGAKEYNFGKGAAFVYYGSASGLSTTSDWSMESNQGDANFGYSVSTAGDVNGDGYSDIIIGARLYDNGQVNEGAAFVYYGSASGLSTTSAWIGEINQVGAASGWSVSTAGDVNGDGYSDVVVGAPNYSNEQAQEGAAYVYYGSASGLSTSANWTAEGNQANAYFGNSVSTAGDVNGDGYSDVVVGAYLYDSGEVDEGAAFVYYGAASGLSTVANWTIESNQAYAYFGNSVSTAGDINGDGYSDIIIGATEYDNGQFNEGAAFVYFGSASGLSTTADWAKEGNGSDLSFGNAVSTAGDVNGDGYSDILVGAPGYDTGGWQADEGKAYVYYGAASGVMSTESWRGEVNQDIAGFGSALSSAGDVNGDGYTDVIAAAPWYDHGTGDEGAAFLYYGSSTGLSAAPDWEVKGSIAYGELGYSVSTAGDVNGDGYADVIIGQRYYSNGEENEGAALVYYGSASGLSATPSWIAEGNQAEAHFGWAVTTAGDINGDGYSDVIVGAPDYDNGQNAEGAIYVYYGSASGLSLTPAAVREGGRSEALLGFAVSTAGDVNGDGYSDIVVGARGYNNGQYAEGGAFVYHGSASGISEIPDWAVEANQDDAWMGATVATAGDVNGDGYSDVIVGVPRYDNTESSEGAAYVYHGSASGLSTTADWVGENNIAWSTLGSAVSSAGDINGDGYSDVVIGAYQLSSGGSYKGAAYVYNGSSAGLSSTPSWTTIGSQTWEYYGYTVASADVNADGYSDILVGGNNYDNGQANEGAVFLYYGNGEADRGVSLKPEQRRSDNTGALSPFATIAETDQLRINLTGRSPYGRGKVKLEVEVKPLGVAFDGAVTIKSNLWQDINTLTGITLTQLVDLPEANVTKAYHWRVRLLYSQVTMPYQLYSRWLTPTWNGPAESDFSITPDVDGDGVNDDEDCAPSDNTKWHNQAYADADGDDVRTNTSLVTVSCFGATPPGGYTLNANGPDNCPTVSNSSQTDMNNNGVGDVCEDSDRDGVLDADELAQGTDPTDAGSFMVTLTNPIYTKYNTYLNQENYVEISNVGTKSVRATITAYNSDGNTVGTPKYVNVGVKKDVNISINQMVGGSDKVGVIKISYNDEDGVKLEGRVGFYAAGSGNTFDMGYTRDFRMPNSGISYALANTNNPSLGVDPVENWIEIINLESSTKRFGVKLYNITGSEVHDFGTISIKPYGERDLAGGHQLGKGSYVVKITPVDLTAGYYASVVRYVKNSSATRHVAALPVNFTAGSGATKFIQFGASIDTCDSQMAYLEMLNPLSSTVKATVKVRNANGEVVNGNGSGQAFWISSMSSKSVDLSEYISAGSSGSVEVTPSKAGGLIAQIMTYNYSCINGGLNNAYMSLANEPGLEDQIGSYNMYLGINNILQLTNTSDASRKIYVTAYDKQGQQLVRRSYVTAAKNSRVLNLSDSATWGTDADSVGQFTVESPAKNQFVARLIRARAINGESDFAYNTAVR